MTLATLSGCGTPTGSLSALDDDRPSVDPFRDVGELGRPSQHLDSSDEALARGRAGRRARRRRRTTLDAIRLGGVEAGEVFFDGGDDSSLFGERGDRDRKPTSPCLPR